MHKELVIPANAENIDAAADFVETHMLEAKFSRNVVLEYRMLTEELMLKLIEVSDPGEEAVISMKRYPSMCKFSFSCKGKPMVLSDNDETDLSGKILSDFAERFSQVYRRGKNHITLTTGTSSDSIVMKNLVSLVLAVIVSILLTTFCSPEAISWLEDNIFFPVSFVFAKAMQTIASPVAFIALATNITTCLLYMSDDRPPRFIFKNYILTSVSAILIGFITADIFSGLLQSTEDLSGYVHGSETILGDSFGDIVMNVIPSNIFDMFTLSNPLPMLLIAVLAGAGAASVLGNAGHRIRRTFRDANIFLCGIMNTIYNFLPIFLFFSLADIFLLSGFKNFKPFGIALLLLLVATGLLFCIYFFNLLAHGISPVTFLREYKGMIIENFKIGSNVDAKPYNYRTFRRKLTLPKSKLMDYLDLGVKFNMDGNCLIMSVLAMSLIILGRVDLGPFQYIELFLVILAMGLGAPNQPGSFVIGIMMVMPIIGMSEELLGLHIILEALTFKLTSFVNSIGDIVLIVCADKAEKKTNLRESTEQKDSNE